MLTRLLHACGLYLGKKNELMPPQADNPDGFWEHLGFVALNDELLNALGGAWDLPPKAERDLHAPGIGSIATESAATDRGLGFSARLGLEGSAQQLNAAVLARSRAGLENANYGAQPVGSRLFDERTQRNVVCVWLAALGNL